MENLTQDRYRFNRQEIADIVGVSPSTLDKWEIPNQKIKRIVYYDIRDAVRYQKNLLQTDDDAESLTREKVRLTRAQAEKTELENDVKKGTMIPSSVVLNVWSDIMLNFKSKLFSIPEKLAPILVGLTAAENRAELQTEMTNLTLELRELSIDDYIQRNVEQEEVEEELEKDAKPKGTKKRSKKT